MFQDKKLDPVQNQGLIYTVASRFFERAKAVGMEPEDVLQECVVIWITTLPKYKPDMGEFSTFFYTCATRKLAATINTELRLARLEAPNQVGGEDEETDIFDLIPSKAQTPEESVLEEEMIEQATSRLSPLTSVVFDLVTSPTKEVYDALEQKRMQVEYGNTQSNAKCRMGTAGVSLSLVYHYLGLTPSEASRVRKELAELARSVQG